MALVRVVDFCLNVVRFRIPERVVHQAAIAAIVVRRAVDKLLLGQRHELAVLREISAF